jgi:TorA maturation chaperone TorD
MISGHVESNSDALADVEQRVGVYQLLARLWSDEIDAGLFAALQSKPLGDAFCAAGGSVLDDSGTPENIDAMQLDYCRLFVGPKGHIPPVQSVFQQGRFEGDAAGSIKQVMEVLGFDRPLFKTLPADHVANLLSTFSTLLAAVDTGVSTQDESYAELADMLAVVFDAHLEWIEQLARVAATRAETSFYRSLLSMTEHFLTEERLLFHEFQSGNQDEL